MMKLNGWKRIGIIASVVWIFGAGAHTYVSENNAKVVASVQCETNIGLSDAAFQKCITDTNDTYNSRGLAVEVAWIAFVPVPLIWAFTYLALFLIRWIRRGFVRESQA